MEPQPPLMLILEKATGEEVTMQIEPGDDFHSFLERARSLLGYDVDINSITRNQPVALTDNVYQFFLKSEQALAETYNNEDLYILDDGTQIRASQIHFDNEDPHVDLTAEKIPFVKYNDLADENDDTVEAESRLYKITESPVRDYKDDLQIPFKLFINNATAFETQFVKYLESNCKTYTTLNTVTNRNKSPRSLIKDNYNKYEGNYASNRNNDDFTHYTREEILNVFKDSPVAALPYDKFNEKKRHARKSDPSRIVHKKSKPITYMDVDGVLIAESESQNCLVCERYIDNNLEKLYLFDNEDQRLHRSSPQKKLSTQLKIICEQCLVDNFTPCHMKSPNQSLNPDEYLVIRNNQQSIYQNIKPVDFKLKKNYSDTKKILSHYNRKNDSEFVKVEIGSDGEIVTNPIEKDMDDVVFVKDERKDSSSDVEIIENGAEVDDVTDNLDDADDELKDFLGIGQSAELKELKCRFCDQVFVDYPAVKSHGNVHKHITEDGELFPCPLCDFGYASFIWLTGHIKAAHEKQAMKIETLDKAKIENCIETDSKNASTPIAKRTRSAMKSTSGASPKEGQPETEGTEDVKKDMQFDIKTEVKMEAHASSDEEIWIVQTADEHGDKQLKILLDAAKKDDPNKHLCVNCSESFDTGKALMTHKCRRKRKRNTNVGGNYTIIDYGGKKSQGPWNNDDSGENSLLVPRTRKRKNKEPTSNPQIVTCHNCNESFTSKVRLKFHMQFHEQTNHLTVEGEYLCPECPNEKFITETALFDHVHFRHHKQRRWRCTVPRCGKTFYLRATLTKHSRTHTDTRRYVCGTCGKRFLDKQTLDEHGVTHLQIKPFQCHICLKQLTRRSRLRMHLRAHEEELRPQLVLVCVVCSRAFRHEGDVQEHLTLSPECIEEFANELKEEESVTVTLSPTSGIVRHTVKIVESPRLSKPIPREVSSIEAGSLLSRVSDEARPITRVVQIEKAFRCEYCEKVFYLEDGLNNHRVIHKGVKNPFTCHICKVSFATYSRCTTHKTTHGFYKRSVAAARTQAECETAGPSATGILGYGDFPVVKHFLCEDCGRSYLHWTYLQVHRRMKHATENMLYNCNQCDMTFPNSSGLSYHRKKNHIKPDQVNATKTRETASYRIPCRDCDAVLPNKTALYKHRKKEHSDMSLKNKNDNGVFWCGYCSKRYTTREELDDHAIQHCQPQQGGQSRADLSHARMQSTQSTLRHACCVCGHSFRSLSMLAEHERVHTGERPFPCDICGVAFRRSTAMRNHRLIHTGVRAWGCPRCPKRFRIRSDLRTHLRLKHPATLVVFEVAGLNPTPELVMERLTANNIAQDSVIEISKMSFPKGTTSIVPCSQAALDMLSHVPRVQIACNRARPHTNFELYQPARRGRGIAKNPRKPKIFQQSQEHTQYGLNQGSYSGDLGSQGSYIGDLGSQMQLVQRSQLDCQKGSTSMQQQIQQQAQMVHPAMIEPTTSQTEATTYPIAHVTSEDPTELNLQLLLRDGVVPNGNQMVQLQLDDSILLE